MDIGTHFRRIAADVLAYGVIAALSRVGGIVLLPVLTRVFSTEEYGLIDLFATSVALLALLVRLALPTAITRYFHDLEDTADRAALITNCLVLVAGLGAGSIGLAWLVCSLLFPDLPAPISTSMVVLAFATAAAQAVLAVPEAVLRVQRRILHYNLVSLLNVFLYVGLAVWWVLAWPPSPVAVFSAHLVGAGAAAALGVWLIRDLLRMEYRPDLLKPALVFGIPLIPAVLMTWANEQTDRLVLLSVIGLTAVSVYAVAAKIAMIFQFAVSMFRQAWQPYSMTLIASKERDTAYRLALEVYMALACSLGLAFMVIGAGLFALLVPREYAGGISLLPWLVGAGVLHHSVAVTNLGVMVGKRTALFALVSMACVLLNIAVSVPLILAFGVAGAAAGTFVAQLALSSTLLRLSNRNAGIGFRQASLFRPLVVYTVFSPAIVSVPAVLPVASALPVQLGAVGVGVWLIWRLAVGPEAGAALRSAVGRSAH